MSYVSSETEISARSWRGWVIGFLWMVALGFVGLFLFVLIIDPYASGRLTPIQRIDVTTKTWGLSKAGVIRDPRFNTALLGTSAAMRLDPARIGEAGGGSVVQLALPGLQPRNQLVLARAFARAHQGRPFTLMFVLDGFWCRTAEQVRIQYDFFPLPTWLYEADDLKYATRLINAEAVKTAIRRVSIWLDMQPELGRLDGFLPLIRPGDPDQLAARLRALPRPHDGPPAAEPFPELDALDAFLATLPPEVRTGFVFAPIAANVLPVPGSAADARLNACKARARYAAERRPDSVFLDLQIDDPVTREPYNFEDEVHYREPVTRWIETQIARMLSGPKGAGTGASARG